MLLLEDAVVTVEVRDGDTVYRFGDGVSRERGLVATAAFHGAKADETFVPRKISGNLVTRKDDFIDSISLSKGMPSISDTRPISSLSASVSFNTRGYSSSSEHPRKIWWQWQL